MGPEDDEARRLQRSSRARSTTVNLITLKMANMAGQNGRADLHPDLGGKLGVIYREVEDRLVKGQYRFGQPIRNADLVEEFRASRAPVTMALNLLRAKGYLVIRPQVGVWVVDPSPVEIRQYFRLLARAEAIHAASAAEHATAEQIRLLEHTRAAITALPRLEGAPKNQERIALVGLFHDQIRMMAGNPWLARQTASIWKMHNFLLANIVPTQSRRRIDRENQKRLALVEAIRRHDGTEAAAMMEEYIGTRGAV